MAMSRFIGLVTARGGSKGIRGKNLREVGGQPLIAWTINAARRSCLEDVLVSTDDDETARAARRFGASIPFMRPVELAEDTTGHDVVIEHAIHEIWPGGVGDTDYIVLLQPTSPFRSAADINGAVRMAEVHEADCIVSVCELAHHAAFCLTVDERLRVARPKWAGTDTRRQALRPMFVPNGAIYVIRAKPFLQLRTYWGDSTFVYEMPVFRSVDVDTLYDLHLTDLLLKNPFNSKDCG